MLKNIKLKTENIMRVTASDCLNDPNTKYECTLTNISQKQNKNKQQLTLIDIKNIINID